MTPEEKKLKVRDEWMALEQSWFDAHINAKELRERADRARMKYAAVLHDEMHAKALQEQGKGNGSDL
ncbi:hypothetical protein AMC83_CH01927 [Rhizobium phaseoli]|uniref:hypothetical protein n=1 Tax=Rhizobium phaseoli TaxID=396 RepID=UPI0007EA342A|nr:hypothetical protein [Rhizobium phaseoli]ANL71910.1 hypothetical protein AMC83_CH01927 [Rhizobium phaseoli]